MLPPRPLFPLFLCVLCTLSLSSCRLALHTLPDSVGRQDFYTRNNNRANVYRCDGVLYVAMEGYYRRPSAGLIEGYNLKDGDWALWPELHVDKKPANKQFYLPMTEQQVQEWNKSNKATARLSFERYEPGVLTEEEMKKKHPQRVAQGEAGDKLIGLPESEATQRSFAHYALKPITVALELADAISVVPMTGAAVAAGAVSAAILVPSTQIVQAFESENVPTAADEPQANTP